MLITDPFDAVMWLFVLFCAVAFIYGGLTYKLGNEGEEEHASTYKPNKRNS